VEAWLQPKKATLARPRYIGIYEEKGLKNMTPLDVFLYTTWQGLLATALWALLITILNGIGIILEPLRNDEK
jgi:hypothetical protein